MGVRDAFTVGATPDRMAAAQLWNAQSYMRRVEGKRRSSTSTQPAKSRKHGAKAGRRKGGGRGGRH